MQALVCTHTDIAQRYHQDKQLAISHYQHTYNRMKTIGDPTGRGNSVMSGLIRKKAGTGAKASSFHRQREIKAGALINFCFKVYITTVL